ncbi:2-succinyl-6-hydroxy-2, 4-cyclohexadiene-1-carboxylate synthase [bacterium HR33]|nr:2-succinyl-6-hydroxy-2, 4-cyclohexadiene-1-carboxylate synthase [bacterium HR33]
MPADRTCEPVLLLLPGMTLNATVFPDLGFATVSPDFTRLVVSPDGCNEELRRKRMGFYCDLLLEELRRSDAWASGWPRIVVGHSFGGMLALEWLTARSADPLARIDGLVLVATTAGPMFDAARLLVGRLLGRELRVPVRPLVRLWNHPGLTRFLARILSRNGRLEYVDFRRLEFRSDFRVGLAGWINTDWRARRSFRIAMEGFDVRERLKNLDIPTMVLHGTRDTYFTVRVAEELARGIPGARLRLIDSAAHLLPLTHPDAVEKAVRELVEISLNRKRSTPTP